MSTPSAAAPVAPADVRVPFAVAAVPRSLKGEALLDRFDNVWLPFDLQYVREAGNETWLGLSQRRELRHAARRPFTWSRPVGGNLHLLNGMGVTLGDSIIGMNVLAWLKAQDPGLRIQLYRSRHAPAYLARLYELAHRIVEPVRYLPWPLASIPADAIDLSDFLHWPRFDSDPMVDFFARGLGIAPEAIPASAKANRWLADLSLPPLEPGWAGRRYVLFCDQASTPLRSVPAVYAPALVERIWRRYRLPVLGFHAIDHPRYVDVSSHSLDLDHYMGWVRHASVVVGTDSSAIHIAAGFDVPTLAMFTSIEPVLRVRDYPRCMAIDMRTRLTGGLHESQDPFVLQDADQAWQRLLARRELPWPE